MNFKNIRYALIFVLFSSVAFCQLHSHHHHHEGHKYEVGLSIGAAHLDREGETVPSTHIHAMRRIGEKTALGLGAEYFFTEHTHYSLLGTISYNPCLAFILDISPGILFSGHDGAQETHFVTHIELTYEFDLGVIGIGPVVGVGFSKEDRHYLAGFHLAKGF
ncbi:hypothetical protein JW935_26640 [candidate division KSB1 bacterium]|nr:hypothetical protein [candidate division KSB1 bacterium]